MTYVIEEKIKGTTYMVNVVPTENVKLTMEQLLRNLMVEKTRHISQF